VQEYKIFLNEYKHQRHSISLEEEVENGNDLADESADAEEDVIKQDRNTALHKAIKQLEPQQQWLVEQVYFLERTQTSIAVELGVSNQAITSRLKKIYEKLKVFLN
jgi:RNA polymerase sigma factor (sigma-70 family)